MAKRIENECAFCAEEIIQGKEVVGKDWKVYCSNQCAESGEKISHEEWKKAMERGASKMGRQGERETREQEASVSLSTFLHIPFSLRGI